MPSPQKPAGQESHRKPSPGAGTSIHVTPGKQPTPEHPSISERM